MKIEEFIESLPASIISGEDVQLPERAIRDIFDFVKLNKSDVFFHLGCGDSNSLKIALKEFFVKKAVGIDNNNKKITSIKKSFTEEELKKCNLICEDILDSDLHDATVILFWFIDSNIIEKMKEKFSNLKEGCKIITLWGPLPEVLPDKVEFPFIVNRVPFRKAKDLSEQLLAVFDKKCIDFVTAWEYAERYTKAISNPDAENDRFLTILQSLVIWINAKKLGVACGEDVPPAIKNYMGILRNFFNIEVEHLLK